MRHDPRALYAASLTVVVILAGYLATAATEAQLEGGTPRRDYQPAAMPKLADDQQISAQHFFYKEVAESGPARGEIIYGYKCFMCHQKNAQDAPHLTDLYKRANLTDEYLTSTITHGSARMPSFGSMLTDSDVADVVAYLKSGTCCVEGENPPKNPHYRAATNKWPVPTTFTGGPRGMVRTTLDVRPGEDTEGVKVQLVAPNGVRTTVYVNSDGRYEFPKMQAGEYTLRIATPLEFKPYRRDKVRIDAATQLEDIVLERVEGYDRHTELLPPRPEILAQLSGSELLWNLPGSAEDKRNLQRNCSSGCHSYQQILRNRYDARSWAIVVNRMRGGYSTPLTGLPGGTFQTQGTRFTPPPGTPLPKPVGVDDPLVQWLAKVRGPDSVDGRIQFFPRARGASTRVVVTEYELPRRLMRLHDVAGDADGNIWFTSHYTRVYGKLDPRTGVVSEYMVPVEDGVLPATHWVDVGPNNEVWMSEPWARKITRIDAKTGQIVKRFPQPYAAHQYNFAVSQSDGSIWTQGPLNVMRVDPETGQITNAYPNIVKERSYDNAISLDGRYWAGGQPGRGTESGNYMQLLDIKSGKMTLLTTGGRRSGAGRGGFDRFGNAWFGGTGGGFVKLDPKTMKLTEYPAPTMISPYTDFYDALPDKNGEVWGGVLHGRGFVRFNPRTDRWVEYQLPEPYAQTSQIWIDNTTTPVTVWYCDRSQGNLVRIQPVD